MDAFWSLPWGTQPRFNDKAWEATAEEAQPFLNVPLLLPDDAALPEGMTLKSITVRPEGEQQWSSVKVLYKGRGRTLRLKQYHFDWWRPTDLTFPLQRTLGFYRAGAIVAAWGRDARGKAVVCTAWGRTTIEIKIEQGTFVESELRDLLASLTPAVPSALPLLQQPCFHELSYHIRRGKGHKNIDELAKAEWHDTVPDGMASPILLAPKQAEWQLDCVARWGTPPPDETQWLLRDGLGTTVLYGRARPIKSEQPLKLPPTYRIQEGWKARQTLLRGKRATVALQHPDLGGWSAAWQEDGHRFQIFVRAGALSGEHGFREMVHGLALQGTESRKQKAESGNDDRLRLHHKEHEETQSSQRTANE